MLIAVTGVYFVLIKVAPLAPHMKKKLTSSLVNSLEPKSEDYEVYDSEETGFCCVVRPSGTKSFCVRYRNRNGQKRAYTIGKAGNFTCKQARDAAKKLIGQINNGIDIQEEKKNRKQKFELQKQQKLGTFFDEKYEPYLLSHTKTKEKRAYLIKHYFLEEWKNKQLTEINQWLVISWRKDELARGLSHAGVNRPISALKAMLERAVEWGVIDNNPLKNVKALHEDPNPIIRFLSKEEEIRLRKALSQRQNLKRLKRASFNEWRSQRGKNLLPVRIKTFTDHLMPMVILGLNTGLRWGELFDLKKLDADLKTGQLVIRGEVDKAGTTGYVPLNKEALLTVKQWLAQNLEDQSDLLFPSPVTGKRLDNITSSWRKLMEQAEIKNFRPHDIRHTFASKLVMRGIDLYTVSRLMRHANVKTTQRYAHLAPDHKARAVEVLND